MFLPTMRPKLTKICSSSVANDAKRQPSVTTSPPMTDVSRVDFRRQTAITNGETRFDTEKARTLKMPENKQNVVKGAVVVVQVVERQSHVPTIRVQFCWASGFFLFLSISGASLIRSLL